MRDTRIGWTGSPILLVIVPLSLAVAVAVAVHPVGAGDPSLLLLSGIALIGVSALIASRYLAELVGSHLARSNTRAPAHRRLLESVPAPAHPNTPGRRRSRAPSLSSAVT